MLRIHLKYGIALSLAVLLVPFAPSVFAAADTALQREWQSAMDKHKFNEMSPPGFLQKRVTRTLSIEIAAPIDRVFDAFAEVDNQVGRHPVIREHVHHEEFERDGVHTRNFTTLEEVPVLFGIPVRINTHAQQRVQADGYSYQIDTWSAPNVVYHDLATFEDLGGGRTRITEQLVFQANVALIDFTVSNGVSGQEQMLRAFKADLESGAL